MAQTQVSDKFFFGMRYNESFVNLVSLIISKVYLITDDGFVSFLKSDYIINL